MIPYLIILLLFFWYFGEIFVYNKKNFIQQKAVSLKREKMSEVLLPLVLTALMVGIILGVLITLKRRRDRQDPTVVIARIHRLSQWVTASSTVDTIYPHESHKKLFLPFKWFVNDKLLLVAHGEFIAGINLQNITQEDTVINGRTIQIKLPQPEMLTPSGSGLDEDKTYVYSRSSGIFAQKKDTETDARRAALQLLREKAAKKDVLLDEATTSASLQLETLLKSMGFTQITITLPGGTYTSWLGKIKTLPDRQLTSSTNKADQQEQQR